MRLSFRGKLLLIVGATSVAFALVVGLSTIIDVREEEHLHLLEGQLVPRLELGPQLEGRFERLRRSYQDAVSAQDAEALDRANADGDRLIDHLRLGRTALEPAAADAAAGAIAAYRRVARDVSRRLINGETGETLVASMTEMQVRHQEAIAALERATRLDRTEVNAAFAAARRARDTAGRVRLIISGACLALLLGLTVWLSRGVLRALREVTVGLARFGRGDFGKPIAVISSDELGGVAESANRMAENLLALNQQRDRTEWLTGGQAGLAHELRGELEPEELAARALAFLTRYLEMPVAAFYRVAPDGRLYRLAQHALGGEDGGAPASFAPGEGLLAAASRQTQPIVMSDPPVEYLRVRSGLGEGPPRCLVLLPLARAGQTGEAGTASGVRGIVELGSWKPVSEDQRRLLAGAADSLAIALEVSEAQVAMRTLLGETQRQAERLAAQEEQLRASNEELQAQQEELRQANDELELQRGALERQNLTLEATRERLEQQARELVSVSAYKSRFLANMSHELRTPLNSMLILSNLMAENEGRNLTDKQVEYARTIHSAGRDLLALINQVLDLAKIEAGKQEVRLEEVPLWEVVQHTRRLFEPLARDKGLTFSLEVEPGLPETIVTDRQRLEQVVTNLLGNAVKFTASGQVGLRLFPPPADLPLPGGLTPGEALVLSVSDTGVGIAPEDQQRVFSPFEQVDGRSDRRYGGSGLGLTIARELVALLGGEMRLESRLGVGSTFSVILPVRGPSGGTAGKAPPRVGPPAPETAGPPPSGARTSDDRNGLRRGDPHLLVVEDDPVFAEQLVEVIHSRGWKVVHATTGGEGLQLARALAPRGLILDVKLPDTDGFQVMEQLRADEQTRAIPVHFVSAVDEPERGWALGAVGYLTKPAKRRELLTVVEQLVPGAGERRRVLVVEDDPERGGSLARLLEREGFAPIHVSSGGAALELLQQERFGCLVLDLGLPDIDGLAFLEVLQRRQQDAANPLPWPLPPVLVHTGRALSREETRRVESYAEAVVLKEGRSAERLVDEIRLFVQHLQEPLRPPTQQSAAAGPMRLDGRKLLVVDDDMRTVYALSALLRGKGAEVVMADTGQAALDRLAQHPDVDAVLMDVMMPEMDGYEATRRLRQQPRFARLPVLALTAKAMKGERERCLEAGATAYMPKPVDGPRLLATLVDLLGGPAAGAAVRPPQE